MSLLHFIHQASASAVVQLPNNNFNSFRVAGTPTYSGVKFAADGNIYERQREGGWSNVGSWLLSGTNSDFYIVRGTPTGSALATDAGAGPLILSSDRIYDTQLPAWGNKTTVTVFSIENIGTDTLASNTYTFYCEAEP